MGMGKAPVKVDYLVIGAGAMGLAFADQLLTDSDATIAIVDRRHRPGGHWNDAYPFVRLHQPSSYYGVNSRPLGTGLKEVVGINAGQDELASSAEILSYFEDLMQQRFLPSGRVHYFPMCDYTAEGEVVSRVSGHQHQIVASKVVDAVSLSPGIPATHPPSYEIAEGVTCAPINDLPKLARPGAAYVVVGAGKTGMDACLWLLKNGAEPDQIRWIKPRESWLYDRGLFQGGKEGLLGLVRFSANEVQAIAEADSIDDVFLRLEATGSLHRLDPSITPTLHHCATASNGELAALRQISNVVRLGRVRRIERDRIILEQGEVPTDSHTVHIDCSASAIVSVERRDVFAPGQINLQCLRLCQPVFSAALIAHVEAIYDDEAKKNAICQVVDMPSDPRGWLRMMSQELPNRARWSQYPELAAFMANCRLDAAAPRLTKLTAADTEELAELERLSAYGEPAIAKVNALLADA
jgi:hypothetical protein